MKRKAGDPCPYCNEPLKEAFLERKEKKRALLISKALTVAAINGEPVGRPKTRDDKKIMELRKQGFSMRAIAAKVHCSTGSVQAALKGTGLNRLSINKTRTCQKNNCWCRK